MNQSIPITSESSGGRSFPIKKVIVALVVVVIGLIAIYVIYLAFTPSYPWLFVGAYAIYEGSTIHPVTNESVDIWMKVEVIDYNKTHVAIKIRVKIVSGEYSNETEDIEWIPISEELVLPARIASALAGPKTKKVYVEGLGVRECYVYSYSLDHNGTVIGYIDKDVMWPIMFDLIYKINGHDVSVTLKLTQSNIPGLTKAQ